MKKALLLLISATFFAIIFSSCMSFHRGYMNSSASLNQPNFTYLKTDIKGIAFVSYILFFGGYNTESLVGEAKQNMLRNNPLTNNQALVNITVSYKTTYSIFPYIQTMCVVTADVVEFK